MRARAGGGADLERALEVVPVRGDLLVELLLEREHALGVAIQAQPRLGRLDAPARPVEELLAEALLPRTHLQADGGVRGARPPRRPGVDAALRTLDMLISASVLILASPILLLVTIVFLATSGTPLFYRGLRVGRH